MKFKVAEKWHANVQITSAILSKEGLSIQKLSEMMNTSRENIYKCLDGRQRITPLMALKFEKVLGIPAEDILYADVMRDLNEYRKTVNIDNVVMYVPPKRVRTLNISQVPKSKAQLILSTKKLYLWDENIPEPVVRPKEANVRAWNLVRRIEKKLKRKLTLDELSSSEKLTAIKDIGPTFAALISKNPELYLKESEIKNV